MSLFPSQNQTTGAPKSFSKFMIASYADKTAAANKFKTAGTPIH